MTNKNRSCRRITASQRVTFVISLQALTLVIHSKNIWVFKNFILRQVYTDL